MSALGAVIPVCSGNLDTPVNIREIRPLRVHESYGVEVEFPGISEKKKDHELVPSTCPPFYRIKKPRPREVNLLKLYN